MTTDELDNLLNPVIKSIPELRKKWEEKKAQGQKSEQGSGNIQSVIEIPPDFWFIEIPRKVYCGLVKMIPEGCISSEKSILDFLRSYLESKMPGCTEGVALTVESCTVLEEHGPGFPSWRLVSRYGLLRRTDDGTYPDEMQLIQEGLETESCGAGGKSKRVVDYKKHMVDWENLLGIKF
ncbi:MAG: hypothetical protein LUD78_04340 [Clostridiales bacterium]|nr:hypothetical protein [Clostridiales bacterium]